MKKRDQKACFSIFFKFVLAHMLTVNVNHAADPVCENTHQTWYAATEYLLHNELLASV